MTSRTPLRQLSGLSDIFSRIGTVWAVIAAVITAVFLIGYSTNDYYTRFISVENSIESINGNITTLQSRINDASQKISDMEKSGYRSPEPGNGATAPQTDDVVVTPPFSATISGLGGGSAYTDSVCPAGYFVSGLKARGSPPSTKYCVGCLVSVQAICKRITLSKT